MVSTMVLCIVIYFFFTLNILTLTLSLNLKSYFPKKKKNILCLKLEKLAANMVKK